MLRATSIKVVRGLWSIFKVKGVGVLKWEDRRWGLYLFEFVVTYQSKRHWKALYSLTDGHRECGDELERWYCSGYDSHILIFWLHGVNEALNLHFFSSFCTVFPSTRRAWTPQIVPLSLCLCACLCIQPGCFLLLLSLLHPFCHSNPS